jgi:hypothetical protein
MKHEEANWRFLALFLEALPKIVLTKLTRNFQFQDFIPHGLCKKNCATWK